MRYRFGPFELDGRGFRLFRDGEALRVEPRVIEFLLYLVERRGRLVTKDELVRSVWEGRHVTDSVLSRAVSLARKALDDDPRDPRFLLTVHGRGYRFAGREVEPVDEEGPTLVEQGARLPESPPASRAAWPWATAAGIGIVLAVVAIAWDRSEQPPVVAAASGERIGLPALDRPVRIGLLPLSFDYDQPQIGLASLSIVDQLKIGLQDNERILVRDLATLDPDLVSAPSMAEVAGRAGVDAVISGWLAGADAGDATRVTLVMHRFDAPGRAVEIEIGEYPVPSLTEPEAMDEIRRLRRTVVGRIAEALGEELRLDEDSGTESPDAYRLYLQAYDRLLRDFCGGAEPALDLLEASRDHDPEFAAAWVLTGVAHYNQVWACGAPTSQNQRALAAFRTARSLAPHGEVSGILESSILVESGDAEAAYELASAVARAHPNLPDALIAEAYVLRYAGFLQRAAALEDLALAIDPQAFAANASGNVPVARLYEGELEAFLDQVPSSGGPYHRFYRGLAAFLSQNPVQARRELESVFRNHPQDQSRLCVALLQILEGRGEEARSVLKGLASERRLRDAGDGEISFKIAQLAAAAGDRETALDEMERALGLGFFCPRCYRQDPLLKGLAGEPRFRRALDAAVERHREFAGSFGLRADLSAGAGP